MKRNDPAKPRARGSPPACGAAASGPRTFGKNLAQKKAQSGPRADALEIARPDHREAYAEQCLFVIHWFKEMFQWVGSDDTTLARGGRTALWELFINGVNHLMAIAVGNSPAKDWAAKLLANLSVLMDEEIYNANEAYRQEKSKLGKIFRHDVWFPKNPLYQALHREIWFCQIYRKELSWPVALSYYPKVNVPTTMPAEYRSILELPPLSLKSWRKWDPKLWWLVKRNNPQLLSELQQRYKRVESRWSKYRKEFRQHLETIATAEG